MKKSFLFCVFTAVFFALLCSCSLLEDVSESADTINLLMSYDESLFTADALSGVSGDALPGFKYADSSEETTYYACFLSISTAFSFLTGSSGGTQVCAEIKKGETPDIEVVKGEDLLFGIFSFDGSEYALVAYGVTNGGNEYANLDKDNSCTCKYEDGTFVAEFEEDVSVDSGVAAIEGVNLTGEWKIEEQIFADDKKEKDTFIDLSSATTPSKKNQMPAPIANPDEPVEAAPFEIANKTVIIMHDGENFAIQPPGMIDKFLNGKIKFFQDPATKETAFDAFVENKEEIGDCVKYENNQITGTYDAEEDKLIVYVGIKMSWSGNCATFSEFQEFGGAAKFLEGGAGFEPIEHHFTAKLQRVGDIDYKIEDVVGEIGNLDISFGVPASSIMFGGTCTDEEKELFYSIIASDPKELSEIMEGGFSTINTSLSLNGTDFSFTFGELSGTLSDWADGWVEGSVDLDGDEEEDLYCYFYGFKSIGPDGKPRQELGGECKTTESDTGCFASFFMSSGTEDYDIAADIGAAFQGQEFVLSLPGDQVFKEGDKCDVAVLYAANILVSESGLTLNLFDDYDSSPLITDAKSSEGEFTLEYEGENDYAKLEFKLDEYGAPNIYLHYDSTTDGCALSFDMKQDATAIAEAPDFEDKFNLDTFLSEFPEVTFEGKGFEAWEDENGFWGWFDVDGCSADELLYYFGVTDKGTIKDHKYWIKAINTKKVEDEKEFPVVSSFTYGVDSTTLLSLPGDGETIPYTADFYGSASAYYSNYEDGELTLDLSPYTNWEDKKVIWVSFYFQNADYTCAAQFGREIEVN